MSTAEVEAVEPEQPATSSTQDETMNTEEEARATEHAEAEAVEVGEGATETKPAKAESKAELTNKLSGGKREKNGIRTDEDGVLKTSAKEDLENIKNNSKYDPSVLPESDDPHLIRQQVEFYFSDGNLPIDKHLWNLTDGSNNLPVKIKQICDFGRMKRFKNYSIVVAALRESEFLDVTGPDGLEEVKRKDAYDPSARRPKSDIRSIYAKGFGDEQPSSQFDIEAFFAPYGPINSVRLRRTDKKLFKGSVFVEFQDVETAEKFLKLDPKPRWKGEHVLKIMPKKQYLDEKLQEIKDGKIDPGPSWYRGRGGRGRGERGGYRGRSDRDGGGRDRGGRGRGDRDPDDWKKRREDDRANGFREDRNRRGNKGGRGRGRDGSRKNGQNRDQEGREERTDKNGGDSEMVDSKSDGPAEEPKVDNKKRAHEDDGEQGSAAKKVDSKPELVSEFPQVADQKSALEVDGGEGKPAKKVDLMSDIATESS